MFDRLFFSARMAQPMTKTLQAIVSGDMQELAAVAVEKLMFVESFSFCGERPEKRH